MPIRLIPDLLTHGDRAMGLPRRHGFAHIIGKGFPELRPKPLPTTHDAGSAHEIAFREWLAHVEAGRMG